MQYVIYYASAELDNAHLAFPYNFNMGYYFLYKSQEQKHNIYNAIGIFPMMVWVLILLSFVCGSVFFSAAGIIYSNMPNNTRLIRGNPGIWNFFFLTFKLFVEPLEKKLISCLDYR